MLTELQNKWEAPKTWHQSTTLEITCDGNYNFKSTICNSPYHDDEFVVQICTLFKSCETSSKTRQLTWEHDDEFCFFSEDSDLGTCFKNGKTEN
jgi:hypothetical protein